MVKTIHLQKDVVTEHTALLGEGPVWDDKQKVICWVDILNGAIHQYSPQQKKYTTIPVYQLIGTVAICTDGNFIAALQNGFAFIDRVSGEIIMISDPESHLPTNRFNDGKCDPAGRFWAGTMSVLEEPDAGSLYMLANNKSHTKKLSQITISNGMAWNLHHQTFYFIDTPTFEVVAFDYDKHTGHIANKRTVIQIDKKQGYPDGMTIDNEGMLWIAHWNGWQVSRWNPNTGQKLSHIKLPVAKVTSCAFGGENLEDLYITTAKVELTSEELLQQPLAGSLFVIKKCGYRGVRGFQFRTDV
jgi:sugar lactone lactonase YvrE